MKENNAAPTDKALVDKSLISWALNTIESMEAWIDGVCTVAGQSALPPATCDDLHDLKDALHLSICDKCGNQKASPAKHKHEPTGETVIAPAAFNGHRPKDGGGSSA